MTFYLCFVHTEIFISGWNSEKDEHFPDISKGIIFLSLIFHQLGPTGPSWS